MTGRFSLIRERQRPVYVPTPAEIRAATVEQRARGLLTAGIWVAIAAVSLWAWLTVPVGGVVR